jgi:hypothetical protein
MHRWIAAAATCGLLLAGCGSEDDGSKAAAPAATAKASSAPASYAPASDVGPNAAIGKDVAAIRALLEPARAGTKPDFEAAAQIWSNGKFSRTSDGTNRTLAEFAAKHPAGTGVTDALRGTGTAAGLSDDQRAEWIDKGMVVALKVHALSEFAGAKEKLAAGRLDPAEGAGHNVDEVWAYFTAGGHGVVATAAKRAKDFGLGEHDLGNDVVAGIAAARDAVAAKDAAALDAAAERTRGAMNRIFALAVKKYAVEGATAATARAEGHAFTWGLAGELSEDDLKAIQVALRGGARTDSATAVPRALDGAAVKLGFSAPLPAYPPTSR